MSTVWQPNPEGLNQILAVLRNVNNAQYINQVEAVCFFLFIFLFFHTSQ